MSDVHFPKHSGLTAAIYQKYRRLTSPGVVVGPGHDGMHLDLHSLQVAGVFVTHGFSAEPGAWLRLVLILWLAITVHHDWSVSEKFVMIGLSLSSNFSHRESCHCAWTTTRRKH